MTFQKWKIYCIVDLPVCFRYRDVQTVLIRPEINRPSPFGTVLKQINRNLKYRGYFRTHFNTVFLSFFLPHRDHTVIIPWLYHDHSVTISWPTFVSIPWPSNVISHRLNMGDGYRVVTEWKRMLDEYPTNLGSDVYGMVTVWSRYGHGMITGNTNERSTVQ